MSEWISVNDERPSDSCYVIVACAGGMVQSDFYCASKEYLRNYGSSYSRKHQGKWSGHFKCAHEYGYQITHWMPLPESPK